MRNGVKRRPRRIKFPSLVRMGPDEYHADPCPQPSLSSHIANLLISKSPRHAFYQHPRLGAAPRKQSRTFDYGNLVHALLLEKGRDIVIIDAADYKKKESQEARDQAYEQGKIPCLLDQFERARETERNVRTELDKLGISLAGGVSEIAAFWEEVADDGTVVQCRAMFDKWIKRAPRAIDLKTSYSAHPDACAAHMTAYGYDLQRAAYLSALGKIFPELLGRTEYLNVVIEVEPPYCITPADAAGTMQTIGEHKWRRAINKWAWCVKNDTWPGYVNGVVRLEARVWELEREMANGAELSG